MLVKRSRVFTLYSSPSMLNELTHESKDDLMYFDRDLSLIKV